MREDEQDLIPRMHELDSFPFDPASPTLRTLQSAIPSSLLLIVDFNSAHAAGEEKLTSFLQDRVFSKNTSLHARVPLNKRLTFAKEPRTEKPEEDLKARTAEMEQSALKAVTNMVEVSQLVNLPELLEHRSVWPYSILMAHTGRRRRAEALSPTCTSTRTLHCSH